MARALMGDLAALRAECDELREQLRRLGGLTIVDLEAKRTALERETSDQAARLERERIEAVSASHSVRVARSLTARSGGLRSASLRSRFSPFSLVCSLGCRLDARPTELQGLV